jgi:hypothetical protein
LSVVGIQIGRTIFRQLRFHALSEPQQFVMAIPKASISGNSERLPVEVKQRVRSIPYRTVPLM